jgi:cysteine desulfurase
MTEQKIKAWDSCIYLDHHATTPLDPRVFEKITPFLTNAFGNAASAHPYGWQAHEAIEEARLAFALAINAKTHEIIFTSGATESSNLALKGIKTRSIISSSIEHGATLSTLRALNAMGTKTLLIKPNKEGLISEKELEIIDEKADLVSLFFVNHELGTINDVLALGSIIKKAGALFHCDATQALGKIPIDCKKLPLDLISFSAHKIYGPKGIGALYVREELHDRLMPLIHGGGQELNKRSGTHNVPAIVGFGEAAQLAVQDLEEENRRIKYLRDTLLANLSILKNIIINGSMTHRISGNLNISFADINGDELMQALYEKIAVSTGSACASMAGATSPVLAQLGISPALREATLRFGIGRYNTLEEIEKASDIIITTINKLRKTTIIKIKRRT